MAVTASPPNGQPRHRAFATSAALLVVLLAIGGSGGSEAGAGEPTACLSRTGSLEELEHCLTLRPDDVDLLIEVSDRYAASGQPDAAAALLERAVRIDPLDAQALVRLASAVIGDDPGAAHDLASRARALRPNDVAVLNLLARSEAQTDR